MKKKHFGYLEMHGKLMCGRMASNDLRETLSEDDVTCIGCLRGFERMAARRVEIYTSRLKAARVAHRKALQRVWRQSDRVVI